MSRIFLAMSEKPNYRIMSMLKQKEKICILKATPWEFWKDTSTKQSGVNEILKHTASSHRYSKSHEIICLQIHSDRILKRGELAISQELPWFMFCNSPLLSISWSAFWMIVPFNTHSLVCFSRFKRIYIFLYWTAFTSLLIQLLIQFKLLSLIVLFPLFAQPPVLVSL